MYDKLTMWIDRYIIGAERFEELRGLDNGKGWLMWGNLRLKFCKTTIQCTGSLNKWQSGQNVVALTFAEAVEAVNDFCRVLGVDPSEVRVSGLEFGATMQVSHHPARYMELLGEASRKKRLPTLSGRELQTIYYMSEGEKELSSFIFYDKGVEAKRCENLLRFEVRYHRQLSRQLYNRSGAIWLSTLCEESFFNLLCDKYLKRYAQVKKLVQIKSADCKDLTPTEAMEMYVAITLNGSISDAERFIGDLKRNNRMSYPKYYSELKGRFKKAVERWGAPSVDAPKLMDELRSLIESEIMRCRPLV